MTDRKLMQQVLYALEHSKTNAPFDVEGVVYWEGVKIHEDAITALRDRLAYCDRCGKKLGGEGHIHTCSPRQPKHDCCANCLRPKHEHRGDDCPKPYTSVWHMWDYDFPPKQQEQEPVAWANKDDLQNFDMRVRTNCDLMHTVPLYTAPKQRKPLTDEEIEACRQQGYDHSGLSASFDFVKAARAIESKLKEKNT